MERFLFNMRKLEPEEFVESFINDLKKIVRPCEYGDQKDSIVRDRIVCGIFNKEIIAKLLEESNFTSELAVKISTSAEASRAFADELSRIMEYKVDAINRQGKAIGSTGMVIRIWYK